MAPSTAELIYARHERGFALHSLRSPTISRLYIQVDPSEDIEDWPDDRIWEQLRLRLAADDWELHDGPVIEKNIALDAQLRGGADAVRSTLPRRRRGPHRARDRSQGPQPCRRRRLRPLAGDRRRGIATGTRDVLDAYTDICLRRVWLAQDFSNYMSAMLHRYPGDDPFRDRLQLARLETLTVSLPAAQALAMNYTGLPLP